MAYEPKSGRLIDKSEYEKNIAPSIDQNITQKLNETEKQRMSELGWFDRITSPPQNASPIAKIGYHLSPIGSTTQFIKGAAETWGGLTKLIDTGIAKVTGKQVTPDAATEDIRAWAKPKTTGEAFSPGRMLQMAGEFAAPSGAILKGTKMVEAGMTGFNKLGKFGKLIQSVGKFGTRAGAAGAEGYAQEYLRSGGDVERAKAAGIGGATLVGGANVLGGAYRGIKGAIAGGIEENVGKALGMTGKMTSETALQTIPKAKQALETLVDETSDVVVKDIDGIDKVFDPTKATFAETLQALNAAKKKVYSQYSQMAQEAGDMGATFTQGNFDNVVNSLRSMAKDTTGAFRNKINSIIDDININFGTLNPKDGKYYFKNTDLGRIQTFIENLNVDVNPLSDKAGARITGEASRLLREAMDAKISSSTGEAYQAARNKYAQLKSIENALVNQFKKSARGIGSGVADWVSGVGSVDTLVGILSGNAAQTLKGAGLGIMARMVKTLRSPETKLQKAFQQIIKSKNEVTPNSIASFFLGRSLGDLTPEEQVTADRIAKVIKRIRPGLTIQDIATMSDEEIAKLNLDAEKFLFRGDTTPGYSQKQKGILYGDGFYVTSNEELAKLYGKNISKFKDSGSKLLSVGGGTPFPEALDVARLIDKEIGSTYVEKMAKERLKKAGKGAVSYDHLQRWILEATDQNNLQATATIQGSDARRIAANIINKQLKKYGYDGIYFPAKDTVLRSELKPGQSVDDFWGRSYNFFEPPKKEIVQNKQPINEAISPIVKEAKKYSTLEDFKKNYSGGAILDRDKVNLNKANQKLNISKNANGVVIDKQTYEKAVSSVAKNPTRENAPKLYAGAIQSRLNTIPNFKNIKRTQESVVRANSDPHYKNSFDMDTNCPKRKCFENALGYVQNKIGKVTSSAQRYLRTTLAQHGIQVPCQFCFVENPRMIQGLKQQKKVVQLGEYKGELLKMKKSLVDRLNQHGGLRFQSWTDFDPSHMPDLVKAINDANKVGLEGGMYSKQPAGVSWLAPTGMKINTSLAAKTVDGKIVEDLVNSMEWKKAFNLRKKYPNVGTVLVAKNDDQIRWALDNPEIDHIIPEHIKAMPKANRMELGNAETPVTTYEAFQSEKWINPKKKDKIPLILDSFHEGDKKKYLDYTKKMGLIPKFPQFVDHPNYMKLIGREYGKFGDKTHIPLKPIFNWERGTKIIDNYIKNGGFHVGIEQKMLDDFVTEIKANKGEAPYDYVIKGMGLEQSKNLSKADRILETDAYTLGFSDLPGLMKKYANKFGNVANADNFRAFFKGYTGDNAAAFQEPVSAFNKMFWRKMLKESKEKTAILYAGGSGTGKTSAIDFIPSLRGIKDRAAAVLDGNLSSYKSAVERINEAIEARKKVRLVYIYRDPIESFEKGVVYRMLHNKAEKGRIVPIKVIAQNHVGSRDVILKLYEEFNNPKMFRFIDNSLGKGKAKLTNVDFVKNIKYADDLEQQLINKAKELYENGTITKKQLDRYLE